MIIGVTHEKDGKPVIRLAKSYKVSIGIPAEEGRNFPKKSDHFHIRAKSAAGEWVDDKPFMDQLQKIYMREVETPQGRQLVPLREFDIIFLSDEPDDIFKTEYAWWSASEKKCSGNGVEAVRKVSVLPEKDRAQYGKDVRTIPWKPCGEKCPDLIKGSCKPSGELMFIFKDRPIMGSVATFTTTSYESIRRIFSSLLQIRSVTGGRLRGIPLKIVVRPGKTRYQQDGKPKTGSAFFVNIEFRQEDYKSLVPTLLQHSAQYEQSLTSGRKLIAESVEDDIVDVEAEEAPESERATEMTSEFYPQNREDGAEAPSKKVEGNVVTDESIISSTFVALGLNPAQREVLYQSLKGDLEEVRAWITEFGLAVERLKMNAMQIHEFYTRASIQPANLKDMVAKFEAAGTAAPTEKPKRQTGATAKATKPAPQQPAPEVQTQPTAPPAGTKSTTTPTPTPASALGDKGGEWEF